MKKITDDEIIEFFDNLVQRHDAMMMILSFTDRKILGLVRDLVDRQKEDIERLREQIKTLENDVKNAKNEARQELLDRLKDILDE